MNSAKIIQGESKGLPFLIKSRLTGQVVNVSTSTCLLYLKANPGDPSPILMKPDAAFDKSNGAAGKLSVTLTSQDTFLPPFVYRRTPRRRPPVAHRNRRRAAERCPGG